MYKSPLMCIWHHTLKEVNRFGGQDQIQSYVETRFSEFNYSVRYVHTNQGHTLTPYVAKSATVMILVMLDIQILFVLKVVNQLPVSDRGRWWNKKVIFNSTEMGMASVTIRALTLATFPPWEFSIRHTKFMFNLYNISHEVETWYTLYIINCSTFDTKQSLSRHDAIPVLNVITFPRNMLYL